MLALCFEFFWCKYCLHEKRTISRITLFFSVSMSLDTFFPRENLGKDSFEFFFLFWILLYWFFSKKTPFFARHFWKETSSSLHRWLWSEIAETLTGFLVKELWESSSFRFFRILFSSFSVPCLENQSRERLSFFAITNGFPRFLYQLLVEIRTFATFFVDETW